MFRGLATARRRRLPDATRPFDSQNGAEHISRCLEMGRRGVSTEFKTFLGKPHPGAVICGGISMSASPARAWRPAGARRRPLRADGKRASRGRRGGGGLVFAPGARHGLPPCEGGMERQGVFIETHNDYMTAHIIRGSLCRKLFDFRIERFLEMS